MKRILSLVLAILLAAALFAGCELADTGSPEGTYSIQTINGKSLREYYAKNAEAKGIDVDTLLANMGIDLNHPEDLFSITLREDGTCEYKNFLNSDKIGTGTWKVSGGKLYLDNGSRTEEFEFKNNKITLDIGSSESPMVLVLGK